jgi:hypothetical protein
MKSLGASWIAVVVWLLGPSLCSGQNSADAAAIAAQQEAEENYKKLSGALDDMKEAQAELTKRLAALEKDLQHLSGESAQSHAHCATVEDLKLLAEKIREVDTKRQADNEKVMSALEKLAKSIASPRAAEPAAAPPRPQTSLAKAPGEKGYWYEVRDKDTFSGIVKACRDQGIKVNLKQVMEANPTVNPSRLRPGDKVWIPEGAQ